MTDTKNIDGLATRGLPGVITNLVRGPARSNRYGELAAVPAGSTLRQTIADEGSYFLFHNNTVDVATTLAGHAAPVLVDIDVTMTKVLLHMINGAAITDTSRVYLDFIEIDVITPGANGTHDMWTAQLDTGATRIASGSPETFVQVNPNMQSTNTSDLVVKGGAITVGAESANCRVLGHGAFRPSIAIAGDRYRFNFSENRSTGGSVVSTSTAHHVQDLGPVILGPTDQFLLGFGAPSQSAAAVYKVRGGFWQR